MVSQVIPRANAKHWALSARIGASGVSAVRVDARLGPAKASRRRSEGMLERGSATCVWLAEPRGRKRRED